MSVSHIILIQTISFLGKFCDFLKMIKGYLGMAPEYLKVICCTIAFLSRYDRSRRLNVRSGVQRAPEFARSIQGLRA
jgi:hypothetical protein